jgi:hypothetical protein
MLGRGGPAEWHAEAARGNFLKLVGNPQNEPGKGWTCDFSWGVMTRLGLDPTNTPTEVLFNEIRRRRLGYRIVIVSGPGGNVLPFWCSAADNGLMPFAPMGDNTLGRRVEDEIGLRCAIGVSGGTTANFTAFGPGTEFIDAIPGPAPNAPEDAAQSWANQALAARFARVLDAHPEYNIWDAREHLRQCGSFWTSGWTETNGYGRANEKAAVGKLLPGAPVDFEVVRSRDGHRVNFAWHNFLQTGFAGTVVARKDGRILYEGTGTNFVWDSDVNGQETFVYWSKNSAGERSRLETYQYRTVSGLECGAYRTCLVLGAPASDEGLNLMLCQRFEQVMTNWVCDVVFRPGNAFYDHAAAVSQSGNKASSPPGEERGSNPARLNVAETGQGEAPKQSFPIGPVVAVLPNFSAMVNYAISNHYRMLIAPVTRAEADLYGFKSDWDRAVGAGVLVVTPHNASPSMSRRPQARRLSPPRLSSAITVGSGITNNLRSFGPGLEFFDDPEIPGSTEGSLTSLGAAILVAGKLAQILDANPGYNLWDARQHLRQGSSYYATGWVEDGGYGRPPQRSAKIEQLDPAPPLEIRAERAADGKSVVLSWENFLQSSFAESVVARGDGRSIYHGKATEYVWRSDVEGEETFKFYSKDKAGRLSRQESFAVVRVEGLRRAE